MHLCSGCLLDTVWYDFRTDLLADEHYFQNYVNRHYSPHAKALVLKYKDSLKTAASNASSQRTDDEEGSTQMSVEPAAVSARVYTRPTVSSEASNYMNSNNGAAVPMPDAPMSLVQVGEGASSLQILCDVALARDEASSLEEDENGRDGEGVIRGSRLKRKRPASVVPGDSDDGVQAPIPPGRGSKRPARGVVQNTQREQQQRRTRKAARRHSQASDSSDPTSGNTNPPAPGGFLNVHTGYYTGPLVFGQHPASFGLLHGMQSGGHPLQWTNTFQSNHAVRNNDVHPHGGLPQLGGGPRFISPHHFSFGGPAPQHLFPYVGGYFNPYHTHDIGQGSGLASSYTGGDGGMGSNNNRMSTSSAPGDKVAGNSSNK